MCLLYVLLNIIYVLDFQQQRQHTPHYKSFIAKRSKFISRFWKYLLHIEINTYIKKGYYPK